MSMFYESKDSVSVMIERLVREHVQSLGSSDVAADEVIQKLMGTTIVVTPPRSEPRPMEMMIMKSSARGGGRSIKPTNIKFDLGLLLDNLTNGVLTLVSISNPWTLPFAVLAVLRSLMRNLTVEVTEADAVTLLAMWQAGIGNGSIARLADIKNNADYHANKHQRSILSLADIQDSIDNLLAIQSIECIPGVPDEWRVKEIIKFRSRG